MAFVVKPGRDEQLVRHWRQVGEWLSVLGKEVAALQERPGCIFSAGLYRQLATADQSLRSTLSEWQYLDVRPDGARWLEFLESADATIMTFGDTLTCCEEVVARLACRDQ